MNYCDDSELVLRAIHESDYDGTRVSPSIHRVYRGKNVSVSRLTIYSRTKIFSIFHRDFDKPKKSRVVAAAEISCGQIKSVSAAHIKQHKLKTDPKRVRCNSIPGNDAHAEIEGTINDGLAKALYRNSKLRRENILVRYMYSFLSTINMADRFGGLMSKIL